LTSRAAKIAHCGANTAWEFGSEFDGGDRDKHGCLPSAGYTWCANTEACIQPWEHNLTSSAALRKHCGAKATWEFLENLGESVDSQLLSQCNCPPQLVIWRCTADEHQAIMNGTECPYYHSRGVAQTECADCAKDAASLACRACANHVSEFEFCSLCTDQGLNDMGCVRCS